MMSDENIDLLLKYPLISPVLSKRRKRYRGIIPVADRDFEIEFELDNRTKYYKIKTKFNNNIDNAIIAAKIETPNPLEFLDNLKKVIEQNTPYKIAKNLTNIYRKVLYEYSEFTRFHINIKSCELSQDLSGINIKTVDNGGREHNLQIAIDYNESHDIFRPVDFELPQIFCAALSKNSASIIAIYDQFLAIIEQLQEFYDSLAEIDESCYILEPENANKRDCYRRIYIDENCSVLVVINPIDVKSRPEMKFLGPERAVEGYRKTLNDNLEHWDISNGIVQAILNILEIGAFKTKPEVRNELLIDSGDCSICFCPRFNEKLPDIVCSNKSCEKFYHTNCLYQWLISVESRRIFNQIHGLCPNCEKAISCPIIEEQ